MSRILGDALPDDAYAILTSKYATTILGTVSEDGYPNTAPVHLILAKDPRTILFALATRHRSAANIQANGRAMICLCEHGDVNVSIRGDARVVRDPMECNRAMCAVRLDVLDVKDDSTHSETVNGIRFHVMKARSQQFIDDVFAELGSM